MQFYHQRTEDILKKNTDVQNFPFLVSYPYNVQFPAIQSTVKSSAQKVNVTPISRPSESKRK